MTFRWSRPITRAAFSHAGCLIAALLLACCTKHSARDVPGYEVRNGTVTLHQASVVTFETAAVSEGPPLQAPAVPARVTTLESLTAPVFAPLSGRIVETQVRLGDRVKRGDRLVEVRSAELPLLHQELESAAAAARAKESEVERLGRMVEARVGSEHDLIAARAELERYRIEAKAAASRIASLEVTQARDSASYFVLAPRAGTIVQLDALAGQVVGPERTAPLATVASIDEVFVVGDVPIRDAFDLSPGGAAHIRLGAGSGTELEGKIEFVAEVVDPARQTVPVRVRVDNTRRLLRPNAYVELVFEPSSERPVVRVPAQAVVSDGPTSVVFVKAGEGKFERRTVQLGRQTSELAEIRAGLERGAQVVVTHALLLLNAVQGDG